MRHFPAQRQPAPLAGLEHAAAPARVSLTMLLLAVGAGFAAGYFAAIHTVSWIVAP